MRERWWGASGRRVPEIATAAELALDEALVLDAPDPERLREAHERGVPVVVRAETPDEVVGALARPEVSCVLVPEDRPELRELDLTKLTYG